VKEGWCLVSVSCGWHQEGIMARQWFSTSHPLGSRRPGLLNVGMPNM